MTSMVDDGAAGIDAPSPAEIEQAGEAALLAASGTAELDAAEAAVFGKKSPLTAANARLGALAPDERREAGRVLNGVRERLRALLASRREGLAATDRLALLASERLDLTEVTGGPRVGHLHPTTRTIELLEDLFLGMGYEVVDLPDPTDPGPGLRLLDRQPLPRYAVTSGRCGRSGQVGAAHLSSFHQMEVLAVDRDLSFADLGGTMAAVVSACLGAQREHRMLPSHQAATEPSAKVDARCTICEAEGCATCAGGGWLAIAECGLVHPLRLEQAGVDPEEWTAMSIVLGVDRLAQMRYAIADVRRLADNDVRLLARI
jgi:phenylalanyl-tRNA synthetase alpha chain